MRMRISTRQSGLALCALAAGGGVRVSDRDAGAADPGVAADTREPVHPQIRKRKY